ncbi:unnamed protein product [Ixodes persulcatus]
MAVQRKTVQDASLLTYNPSKMERCWVVLLICFLLETGPATAVWLFEDDTGFGDKISFTEKPFECPRDRGLILPSTMICDGQPQCSDPFREDERNHACAPRDYLLRNLTLKASNTTKNYTFLEWSSGEEPETVRASSLKFGGYFLTAKSFDHLIERKLSSELKTFILTDLKAWTEYNITLRRFYISVVEEEILPMKIGRAATVTIRTNPSEPDVPKDVRIVLSEKRKLLLEIKSPEFWNGPPSKYRIRWEPKDPGRGSRGYKDIDIASTWTPKQKWTTANVTLEPGLQYKVFVSAQNSISTGISFWGPEYANEVATIPLDPFDLVAESLTPTEVLISWRSTGPSEYFQVKVKDANSAGDAFDHILSNSNGEEHFHARVIVDSEQLASSEQSIMVDDLLPSRNYTVELLACTSNECSGKLTAKVITKPTFTPKPNITRVTSNLNSFVVSWTFPQDESGYYDGFQVHYCREPLLCQETYTYVNLLNVSNLTPNSTYDVEVRVRIKHVDGRVELGPLATVQVKTWSELPQEPGLDIRAPGASANSVLLSWVFINSSVTQLQFLCKRYRRESPASERLPNPSPEEKVSWTNCSSHAGCSAVVIGGGTPSFKTGFLSLKKLRPFTKYNISVRGCNNAGCGGETTLPAETSVSAPSAPRELAVSKHERNGTLVVWEKPLEPAGNINGYTVARRCPNGERLSTVVPGDVLRASLGGLPLGGANCTFWVTAFNENSEGHLLLGRAAEITFPNPVQYKK